MNKFDYKQWFTDNGWKVDPNSYSGEGDQLVWRRRGLMMRTTWAEAGILDVDMCPSKVFDRWANSSHIEFVIDFTMVNTLDWQCTTIEKQTKTAMTLCKKIPNKLFNQMLFINIT